MSLDGFQGLPRGVYKPDTSDGGGMRSDVNLALRDCYELMEGSEGLEGLSAAVSLPE